MSCKPSTYSAPTTKKVRQRAFSACGRDQRHCSRFVSRFTENVGNTPRAWQVIAPNLIVPTSSDRPQFDCTYIVAAPPCLSRCPAPCRFLLVARTGQPPSVPRPQLESEEQAANPRSYPFATLGIDSFALQTLTGLCSVQNARLKIDAALFPRPTYL